MNRGQIRLLKSKSTDLVWCYSRYHQKLKIAYSRLIIHDLREEIYTTNILQTKINLAKHSLPPKSVLALGITDSEMV